MSGHREALDALLKSSIFGRIGAGSGGEGECRDRNLLPWRSPGVGKKIGDSERSGGAAKDMVADRNF